MSFIKSCTPQPAWSEGKEILSEVSEDIMKSHGDFLSAIAHMNLRKQSVYYHAVIELVNKLPVDFEKFAAQYSSVGPLQQHISQFESHVKRQINAMSNRLKVLLRPL